MPNLERFAERNRPIVKALREWAEKERKSTPKPDPKEKVEESSSKS